MFTDTTTTTNADSRYTVNLTLNIRLSEVNFILIHLTVLSWTVKQIPTRVFTLQRETMYCSQQSK